MSGPFVKRSRMVGMQGYGGLGLSINDIPILGRAVEWADDKVRQSVEYIIKKYAEFEQVAANLPAQRAEAERLLAVIQNTNSTPNQIEQAQRLVALTQQTEKQLANRGAVDQVVAWARSAGRSMGLGVPVLIPLWIAGTASVAIYAISSAIKSYNDGNVVRAAIQAGLSPEQIAKLGSGRGGLGSFFSGATSGISAVALGIGALLAFNLLGRRSR